MKPPAEMVLIAMIILFGFVAITPQVNNAFAASAEKITLVQQYTQFPGQVVTGFCNIIEDSEGNLTWRIKVNGLEPGTRGHFDLGHWAGEVDVPYTADDQGNADSKNQIVLKEKVAPSIFSQFAECHVRTTIDSHLDNPGIALGEFNGNDEDTAGKNEQITKETKSTKLPPGIALAESTGNANADENKKLIQKEKKFFLFSSLDWILGIFINNNSDADENNNLITIETKSSPPNPPGLEKTETIDESTEGISFFGPPSPPSFNRPSHSSGNPQTTDDQIVSNLEASIFISSPTENSVVKTTIKIKANVINFPDAVVIFYVDGYPIGTDFKAPYEMTYQTKDLPPGKHLIKAEISSTEINHTVTVIQEEESNDDKSSRDKGDVKYSSNNQGKSNKGKIDKDSEPKSCNPGQHKKGLC